MLNQIGVTPNDPRRKAFLKLIEKHRQDHAEKHKNDDNSVLRINHRSANQETKSKKK
jgi:hypothetical protein